MLLPLQTQLLQALPSLLRPLVALAPAPRPVLALVALLGALRALRMLQAVAWALAEPALPSREQ